MKEVLVVAAHPDDELLGLGGTIRRLVNEGVICRALIIGEGITSRAGKRSEADARELEELREDAVKASKIVGYSSIDLCQFPDNRLDSVDLLDVIKTVSEYMEKYNPDTIFTHHHGDLNIDHRVVCEAVITACRPVGNYNVKRIYAFETPSSTEWNYTYEEPFVPNVYFDVTDTVTSKVDAMRCYRSESTVYPHPRSSEALLALASYRGSNVGVRYAEGFELLREVL